MFDQIFDIHISFCPNVTWAFSLGLCFSWIWLPNNNN